MFSILLPLLIFVTKCECARILAITPFPSTTHTLPFMPIWRNLTRRGHEVTLITSDLINDPSLTNLKEIDVSEMYQRSLIPDYFETITGSDIGKHNEIFRGVIQMPEVKEILLNATERFDLIMADVTSPIWSVLSHRFKCPVIGLLPNDLYRAHLMLGNPTNPALHSDYYLDLGWKLNVFEKLFNIYSGILILVYENFFMYNRVNQYVEDYYLHPLSVQDYVSNIEMIFINAMIGFHKTRPVYEHTVYIGGGRKYFNSTKDFGDLEFLNNMQNVILINFEDGKLDENILDTIPVIPYSFIWLGNRTNYQKHKNVMFLNNIPQYKILEHPNVKLFITSGTTIDVENAIFYQVPILAIPRTAEERENAEKIELEGIGKVHSSTKNFDVHKFKRDVKDIIKNANYSERIKEYSIKIEQPISGLEKSILWSEWLLKNTNNRAIKSPALQLNLIESYYLDIIFASLLLGLIAMLIGMQFSIISVKIITDIAEKREKQF